MEDGVILYIMNLYYMWLLTCVPNFRTLAWLCQESPVLKVHAQRTLMVPDWRLGGWGHPWQHKSSWYVIIDVCAKFQLFSMIRNVSGTPVLEVHMWRMLMVPDWGLGGWGHLWCYKSSWSEVIDLCAKFQLSSMIRSVSRTTCPRSPYLEDVDGS